MMRKMKDSGIPWIGKIPESWEVIRLKHTSSLKGRIGWQGLKTDEYQEEGPYLITGTDFDNGIVNWDTCVHISEQRFQIDLAIQVKEDDLLITKDGTIGKVAVCKECPEKACLNSGVFILRNYGFYKYYSRYMFYILSSDLFTKWYEISNTGNSTIRHLNQEKFYNFSYCFPPLPEQRSIADFLDAKCAEIDALCADIQAEIDTLEEYKRSVITETVTKGLDPNVPMKDSGIPWIGEIPQTWNIHRLLCYYSERVNLNILLKETNLLSLSYGNIIRKDINTVGGLLPASYSSYNIVEKNDIIIRPTDLQNDRRSLRTGLVRERGIITSAYIALKPIGNLCSRFYHYLLHAYDVLKVFYNMGNGVRQGLNFSEFSKLLLLEPPLPEQRQIADFLDAKCAEIDAIIAEKRESITTLSDYKKSLIYEYVTGKKEVPHE